MGNREIGLAVAIEISGALDGMIAFTWPAVTTIRESRQSGSPLGDADRDARQCGRQRQDLAENRKHGALGNLAARRTRWRETGRRSPLHGS